LASPDPLLFSPIKAAELLAKRQAAKAKAGGGREPTSEPPPNEEEHVYDAPEDD
jgi:hypothetical protein